PLPGARSPGHLPAPTGPLRPAQGLVGRLRRHALGRLRQPHPARGRLPGAALLRLPGAARPAAIAGLRPGDPPRHLGNARPRRGQLEHLLAAGARPNVTVQVLPFAAGLPPVTAGSFSVLDSLATGAPDVVYLENKTRVFFIDAETEVHRYTQAYDYLSTQALT